MLAFQTETIEESSVLSSNYRDIYAVLAVWLFIAFSYHSLVVICCFGGIQAWAKSGPIWFWIMSRTKRCSNNTSDPETCRIARYFKCQKRANRRRSDHCCLVEVAHRFAKLHMPPPLPLRRRRRAEPSGCSSDTRSQDQDLSKVDTDSHKNERKLDTTSENETATSYNVAKTSHAVSKKKRRKSMRVNTALIDLARMQHWSPLIERAIRDKREARYQDADGLLPLHWAVSGGPPQEVVENLLRAYPPSASVVDNEGSTALHFACCYGASPQVVQLILRSYEPAIRKLDNYGRSPLYHAVDKSASMETLQILVESDPSMITTPCVPSDPERAHRLRQRDDRPLQHRTPLYMAWAQVVLDKMAREKQSGRVWEKAQVLLQASYAYHSSQRIYRMVHASVALDHNLPREVLHYALKLYPQQLREREESMGRTPLAMAASLPQPSMQESQELISTLLAADPQAARIPDHQCQFPITLAATSGKAWSAGLQDLFGAAPDLVSRRDGVTKLVAALAAASSTPETTNNAFFPKRYTAPLYYYSSFALRGGKALDWQKTRMQESSSSLLENHEENRHTLWETATGDSCHVSTIFELLRADPSIMK